MIDKPILINNYQSPEQINFELLPHNDLVFKKVADNNIKLKGGKFVFSKFETDKERIKNKEEKELETHLKIEKKSRSISMRYKFRTDLERVYESINKFSYGRVNKKIIQDQLLKLKLIQLGPKINKKEKDETMLSSDNDNKEDDDEDDVKKKKEVVPAEKPRKFMVNKTMQKLNEGAMFVLGELHNKTHFKGLTSKLIHGKHLFIM